MNILLLTDSSSLMISRAYFLADCFPSSFTLASFIAFKIITIGNVFKFVLLTHIEEIKVATSFLRFSNCNSLSRSLT